MAEKVSQNICRRMVLDSIIKFSSKKNQSHILLTFFFISTNVSIQSEYHYKKKAKHSHKKLTSPSNGGQGKLQLPPLDGVKLNYIDSN